MVPKYIAYINLEFSKSLENIVHNDKDIWRLKIIKINMLLFFQIDYAMISIMKTLKNQAV